jgi:hypothetical protein
MLGETDTELRTRMLRTDDWSGVIPVEVFYGLKRTRGGLWVTSLANAKPGEIAYA